MSRCSGCSGIRRIRVIMSIEIRLLPRSTGLLSLASFCWTSLQLACSLLSSLSGASVFFAPIAFGSSTGSLRRPKRTGLVVPRCSGCAMVGVHYLRPRRTLRSCAPCQWSCELCLKHQRPNCIAIACLFGVLMVSGLTIKTAGIAA